MSEAREQILEGIRAALRGGGSRGPGDHGGGDAAGIGIPRAPVEGDPASVFTTRLEATAATWEALASMAGVPDAVRAYLQDKALPPAVVATGDAPLRELERAGAIAVEHRAARDEDRVSVTSALAAVAETGSLLLVSSANTPTTLNFLPEHHLVVLEASTIVPYLEDLWPIVRSLPEALPRTLNLITGPSRTADVEQTIQLGAHGPRRLHVLLIAAP